MNELWKTLRLAGYVLALPLVATAAVSAYQWQQAVDPPIRSSFESTSVSTTIGNSREHDIRLTQNGTFTGKIWFRDSADETLKGASNLRIQLMKSGQVVARSSSEQDGSFSMTVSNPGVYSFVAECDELIAIHAVRLIQGESAVLEQNLPFETIAITRNQSTVDQILKTGQEAARAKSTIHASVNDSLTDTISSNRVQLDEEGTLKGKLVASIQIQQFQNRVILFRDGAIVAETRTNKDGTFRFENLKPGYYEFLSSGEGGSSAFGFDALPMNLFRRTSLTPSTQDSEVPSVLQTPLASPQDILTQQQDQPPVNTQDLPPFVGNGFGGIGPAPGFTPIGGGIGRIFGGSILFPVIVSGGGGGSSPAPTSPSN